MPIDMTGLERQMAQAGSILHRRVDIIREGRATGQYQLFQDVGGSSQKGGKQIAQVTEMIGKDDVKISDVVNMREGKSHRRHKTVIGEVLLLY